MSRETANLSGAGWGEGVEHYLRRVFAPPRPEPENRTGLARAWLRHVPLLMLYGGLMGSWGMWGDAPVSGGQWMQVLFSAIKVPLLLGVTFFLSLPCFFVLYALAGLASEFRRVVFILAGTQEAFAAVLLALVPFTLLWYSSTTDYTNAVLFNGLIFGIAVLVWQIMFRRACGEIPMRHYRHRLLLRLWFLVYAFLGVQVSWMLRPFIGMPGMKPEFIRSEGWSNAYVEIAVMIMNALP